MTNQQQAGPSGQQTPPQQQQQAGGQIQAQDITGPLVRQLGKLFSREDKKLIPIFKGTSSEILVTDWIKEAERVAKNNGWDDEQKLRFYSDRLKDEALDWYTEYMDNLMIAPDYDEWKKDFIERFRDASDIEPLKRKLANLTQKPEQKTKA